MKSTTKSWLVMPQARKVLMEFKKGTSTREMMDVLVTMQKFAPATLDICTDECPTKYPKFGAEFRKGHFYDLS